MKEIGQDIRFTLRMRSDRMTNRPASLHWAEYLIEAGALGTFMVSAAAFAAVLYQPSSPVAAGIANEWVRRGLMGLTWD
jgi:hypothetical protein